MIRVTAPGKLVLLGEYAVLDGGASIVAAVDRGVSCEALASHELTIETPGGDDRFVRAAIEASSDSPNGHFRFFDQNPTATANKAGFGRSAAATVAALLAATRLAGHALGTVDLRTSAHRIHHSVQGNGSGIDVAASVYGGLIRVEGDTVHALSARQPIVVFSGQSAQTGPRVETYLQHSNREAFVRASSALVDAFQDEPVRALSAGGELIGTMCRQAGIHYWTPALEAIVSLAKEYGGGGKPSGAGGGDSAVALFECEDDAQHFVTACREQGFSVIPAVIAPGAHSTEPNNV